MYTIYIPKREREKAEHEITKVIHAYLQLRPNTSGVICFPGYMTRDERIEDYWRNLFGNIVKGDFYISFSKGMTGETRRKLNKETIENGLVNNLKYFDIDIPTPKDHSKVMLFYKSKCDSARLDSSSPENDLSEFIEKNTIEAMLIGSSNQSHSTYFGEYASYGETDIMMIACNHLDDTNCRTPKEIFFNDVRDKDPSYDITIHSVSFNMDKCVVAKSINYTTYDRDIEFFKNIAEDLFGIKHSSKLVKYPQ